MSVAASTKDVEQIRRSSESHVTDVFYEKPAPRDAVTCPIIVGASSDAHAYSIQKPSSKLRDCSQSAQTVCLGCYGNCDRRCCVCPCRYATNRGQGQGLNQLNRGCTDSLDDNSSVNVTDSGHSQELLALTNQFLDFKL